MEKYKESDLYYTYWKNTYFSNEEVLNELDFLKKNYPDFPFELFVKNVFTKELIDFYGLDFLLATSKFKSSSIYKYGMLSSENLSKLKLYLSDENLKRINCDYLFNLSYDKFLKLKNVVLSSKYVDFFNWLIKNDKDFSIVNKIINKENSYYIMEKVLSLFKVCGKFDVLLKYIDDSRFLFFLNNLDSSFLLSNSDLSDYIKKFEYISELFSPMIMNDLEKKIYNSIVYSCNSKLPNTLTFENFFDMRYEYIYELIDSDFSKAKAEIARLYYCLDISSLKVKLYDAKRMFNNSFNKKYGYLLNLFEISSKDQLRHFLDDIKYEINIYDKLEKIKKEIVFKKFEDELSKVYVNNNFSIVKLSGQPFMFLLHKIKGYGNYSKAQEFLDNYEEWFNKQNSSLYISTSLCDNSFLGLIDGYSSILGFNNISQFDIIDMGTEDISMSSYMVESNIRSNKSRLLFPDELLKKTSKIYNEVAIKRFNEDKIKAPNFVFVRDKYTLRDSEIANFFNIPIVILDSRVYLDQMLSQLNVYRKKLDLYNYVHCLKRIYFSFYEDYDIVSSFISTKKLISDFENIVSEFTNTFQLSRKKYIELLYFIEEFKKLIDLKCYIEDDYFDYSVEHIKEKIKKSNNF